MQGAERLPQEVRLKQHEGHLARLRAKALTHELALGKEQEGIAAKAAVSLLGRD